MCVELVEYQVGVVVGVVVGEFDDVCVWLVCCYCVCDEVRVFYEVDYGDDVLDVYLVVGLFVV